jgi:secondary thiamine-phosphate synthase enzyme
MLNTTKKTGRILAVIVFVFFSCGLSWGQAASEEDTQAFTEKEKQILAEAKDSEAQLHAYLSIANERLKALLSAADRRDRDGANLQVPGYRKAIGGADESLNQIIAANKNNKKNLSLMFKTTREQATVLLRKIEKASEEIQPSLQSALEVVQRVQGGLMIQMEKYGMTPQWDCASDQPAAGWSGKRSPFWISSSPAWVPANSDGNRTEKNSTIIGQFHLTFGQVMRNWIGAGIVMIKSFQVSVSGQGLHPFTHLVEMAVRESGIREGLCTIFIPHTSASLLIQENADPSAQHDLERWLNRLVKEGDPIYTHKMEGADDMPSHIKAALTATSLSIPIVDGYLALGTWQGIYLWEHRHHHGSRRVILHLSA